jgi:hypothetical protein
MRPFRHFLFFSLISSIWKVLYNRFWVLCYTYFPSVHLQVSIARGSKCHLASKFKWPGIDASNWWRFFSSPELKAQMSFSDRPLSGVRLSVNFYIFDFSRTNGPILTRLGTNRPWVEEIQVCSNEQDSPYPRGDNSESVKIHWRFLNFSRTSRSNLIKFNTHYPWVKGIQVCANKGPGPLQRGDNCKNVRMGLGHLKSSPEPLGQF